MIAEKLFKLFSGLFIGVYVARYLGVEQFGQLNYAISFVFLFSELGTLGLTEIVTRELVKQPENKDTILGTSFFFRLLSGCLGFILVVGVAFFTHKDLNTFWLICIISSIFFFKPLEVVMYYYQANVNSKFIVKTQLLISAIIAALKLTGIFLQLSVPFFAICFALEIILTGIGFIILYQKQGINIFLWKVDKQFGMSLLKDSLPLMFSGIIVTIYMYVDQIMITQMIDDKANGNYVAALKLSQIWYFVPMVVCSSIFPAILEAKKQNKELYYRRLQQLFDLLAGLAIVTAIATTFLSDFIIDLLYGQKFNQAADVLTIHIWVGVFVSLGVSSGQWLIAENLTRISLKRNVASVIINITFNFILIPSIGINGAAFAILISGFFGSYLYDFFDKSTRHIFFMKTKSLFGISLFTQLMKLLKTK